jgi:hypothetical protein
MDSIHAVPPAIKIALKKGILFYSAGKPKFQLTFFF